MSTRENIRLIARAPCLDCMEPCNGELSNYIQQTKGTYEVKNTPLETW